MTSWRSNYRSWRTDLFGHNGPGHNGPGHNRPPPPPRATPGPGGFGPGERHHWPPHYTTWDLIEDAIRGIEANSAELAELRAEVREMRDLLSAMMARLDAKS
jgi:hypothetical protein